MKIYSEDSLRNFDFWSGAKDNAAMLTDEELDAIEAQLEDLYPEGMEDTQVNDLFRFDFEAVCEWIGLEYDATTDKINRGEEEEEEEE